MKITAKNSEEFSRMEAVALGYGIKEEESVNVYIGFNGGTTLEFRAGKWAEQMWIHKEFAINLVSVSVMGRFLDEDVTLKFYCGPKPSQAFVKSLALMKGGGE